MNYGIEKMGRETHVAFTCENTFFLQFGTSCELGNRKNGTGSTKVAPMKTQCFAQLGLSCELGNRKKWDGRQTGGIYL